MLQCMYACEYEAERRFFYRTVITDQELCNSFYCGCMGTDDTRGESLTCIIRNTAQINQCREHGSTDSERKMVQKARQRWYKCVRNIPCRVDHKRQNKIEIRHVQQKKKIKYRLVC